MKVDLLFYLMYFNESIQIKDDLQMTWFIRDNYLITRDKVISKIKYKSAEMNSSPFIFK